jgi:magnesium transporter
MHKHPTKTWSGKVEWIDIVHPTADDLAFIGSQHKFHPLILRELIKPSARSRAELYRDYIYLTYHLPVFDAEQRTSRKVEVDFLITKRQVITVHFDDFEPFQAFESLLETNHDVEMRAFGESTAILVYYLLQGISDFEARELKHIEEHIQNVSGKIFSGRERELLEQISYVKRDLIDYRRIARPEHLILTSLRDIGIRFWGDESRVYLEGAIGDNLKIQEDAANSLETLESLEETNAQLFNSKSNRIMQQVTILAFLTFPLVLFTTVYAVAERGTSFWTGFGMVFAATLLALFILKRRDLV